jgi:hypothetical protein
MIASLKVKVVKAKRVRAVSEHLLRQRLKNQKMKAIADSYKTDDPCACIKSAGNGL